MGLDPSSLSPNYCGCAEANAAKRVFHEQQMGTVRMGWWDEQARDHPSLTKYPGGRVTYVRDDDGVLWRVPVGRDRDEAVPVPVEDLVQARGAIHRLKVLLEKGAGDESEVEMIGYVVNGTSEDEPPLTRAEVITYLDSLWKRLNGSLPGW